MEWRNGYAVLSYVLIPSGFYGTECTGFGAGDECAYEGADMGKRNEGEALKKQNMDENFNNFLSVLKAKIEGKEYEIAGLQGGLAVEIESIGVIS